jgi:hypothetical protein
MSLKYLLANLGFRLSIACALALLPPLGQGCSVLGSSGPSAVGQGKEYVSGHAEFDQFFHELFELQVAMAQAPDTQKSNRQALAEATGAGADAAPDALIEKVKERLDAVAAAGVHMRLVLPELARVGTSDERQSARLDVMGATPAEDGRTLIEAVQKAANDELTLLASLRRNKQRIDALPNRAATLDTQVDTVFRKSLAKRSEVHKNIEDAQKLIPLMRSRADELIGSTEQVLPRLKQAVDHNAAEFDRPPPPPPPPEPEPPPEEDKKTKKKKGSKQAPAPAPEPASGSEFEP